MPTETPVKKTTSAYVPAYRRIEADLRSLVSSGAWPAGSLIPGRRELANNYGVDLNTVQSAIRSLLDDGTLRAEGRSGTYVSGVAESGSSRHGLEPVKPLRSLSSRAPHLTTTVGIMGALWGKDDNAPEPHENWPAAILRAFECAIAAMPGTTVKFREIKPGQGSDPAVQYYDRLRELMAEGIDALAIIAPPESMIPDLEAISQRYGFPIVLIRSNGSGGGSLPSVTFDFEFGGFQAGHHLIQRGYETISVFNPYLGTNYTDSRIAGVELALRRAGRELYHGPGEDKMPRAIPDPVIQRKTARSAARVFLMDRPASWGVVAVNDHAGHALIDVAAELGLTVGADFGLIGFDDLSESRVLDMSSLHPPLEAMGTEAAKVLRNLLDGQPAQTEVRLRSNLVARASTQIRSGSRSLSLDIATLRQQLVDVC